MRRKIREYDGDKKKNSTISRSDLISCSVGEGDPPSSLSFVRRVDEIEASGPVPLGAPVGTCVTFGGRLVKVRTCLTREIRSTLPSVTSEPPMEVTSELLIKCVDLD